MLHWCLVIILRYISKDKKYKDARLILILHVIQVSDGTFGTQLFHQCLTFYTFLLNHQINCFQFNFILLIRRPRLRG